MAQTAVKQYKTGDINPAIYNPREISSEAFEGLKASIRTFGLVENLVVNIRDNKNVLVGGHQRLRACIDENINDVPVIEVDLNETEEKALNIALNSQEISGNYTADLQPLLEEIRFELPEYEDLKLNRLEIELTPVDDLEEEKKEKEKKYSLSVIFPNEATMLTTFEELSSKGYIVEVAQ